MIIDDEPDIVEALKMRLEIPGYEVISAGDGLAGLEKVRSENPDIILLDVMLPKLDGFKVCRMIKFDERFKDIPIIMLTAKAADIDKTTGGEVGADCYLTKPFDPTKLLDLIAQKLEKKKK